MSLFETKHYSKIAETFHNLKVITDNAKIEKHRWVFTLAKMFKDDNPKFNEVRFIDACYGGDEG